MQNDGLVPRSSVLIEVIDSLGKAGDWNSCLALITDLIKVSSRFLALSAWLDPSFPQGGVKPEMQLFNTAIWHCHR